MARYKQGWQLASKPLYGTPSGNVVGPFMHHQRDIDMKLIFSPDGKYTTSCGDKVLDMCLGC